jgi:fructose-1,6-bisphosphatase/inositol monophosphatase family enzyme
MCLPRSTPTAVPGQGFWTDLRVQEVGAALEATVVATLGSIADGGLELADSADLKSHHRVDDQLSGDITAWWQDSRLPVRLYLEGQAPQDPPGGTAVAALLIDPIDGSINRDLMVGDPGFALAVADTPVPRFGDLTGGWVYGLHSGDRYHTAAGQLWWTPRGRPARAVRCDARVTRLEDAILYYNDGYGSGFAHAALRRAGFLPLRVRHHNAFDNTALELAQICRGAAHLRVEARSYVRRGVRRGSDHANILPAFALGRYAGLVVGDLDGCPLDELHIDMDCAQDFVVASSNALFDAVCAFLGDNLRACPLRQLCEERPEPQRGQFEVDLG